MNKHAMLERNRGILLRHVRGERTLRQEAEDQGLRYQRIDQIIQQTSQRLFKELKREGTSRSEVLALYGLNEEQVLKLALETSEEHS